MTHDTLTVKNLGINTQNEHHVYMRSDCHICLSEGFEALTRLKIKSESYEIIANLNVITSNLLAEGEIGISQNAMKKLNVQEGESVMVEHMQPLKTMSFIRSKIYGKSLTSDQLNLIVEDIKHGRLSNVEMSAFITACAGNRMSLEEIADLTESMIHSGETIKWDNDIVVDKHCIGGLPGNRTTPLVVSIVSAMGLMMPKTSSRAITSPAGTADTMEVMTNVNLNAQQIKEVVKQTGGCFVWGGTANLSPADDILIKIEKALDLDSEGQLIASVLSKKVAAGSNCVLIDFPVGESAKLRSMEEAKDLKEQMEKVAQSIGLKLKIVITDGSQPVGMGIGPSLEAIDILKVLRNTEDAPQDLKSRAILLAGELLELSGTVAQGKGKIKATALLEEGKALEQFMKICQAQGRFSEPKRSTLTHDVLSKRTGEVTKIDNRKIAKVAKLAGAPESKLAGLEFFSPIGTKVQVGQILYRVHAESEGELKYAINYLEGESSIIEIK